MEQEKLSIKFYQTDDDLRNNLITVEVTPKEYADKFAQQQEETIKRLNESLKDKL